MDEEPRGFARECCVQTVARVCMELGFDTAEESALEAVADVVRYFVSSLARRTHANMIHSQRTTVALNDLLAAFRQVPSAPVSWRALQDFAFRADGRGWNVPSHLVVPVLPICKRQRVCAKLPVSATEERSVHVPKFLPPFPPAYTYRPADDEAKGAARPQAALSDVAIVREREALQLALNRICHTAHESESEEPDEWPAGSSAENPVII